MSRSLKKGFTLIELLIVVAIIAILAAIAVPNFLEAQVRAKVSRAKSDMRTISVGIESYSVDNNKPPVSFAQFTVAAPNQGQCGSVPTGTPIKEHVVSRLTTPIAYLTSFPQDPFREKGVVRVASPEYNYLRYEYASYNCPAQWGPAPKQAKAFQNGFVWVLNSIGPSRQVGGAGIPDILNGDVAWVTNPKNVAFSYDPSNGSTSVGIIVRTNKGEFTMPKSVQ